MNRPETKKLARRSLTSLFAVGAAGIGKDPGPGLVEATR